MRTNANFFGVACITMSLWYLRASTAIMIQNIYPIIVMILSHFVFHEKIYFRYIIGIIMCFSGSSIIVFKWKKINKENDKSLNYVSYYDTFIGLTFAFVDIIFVSSVKVSKKILVNSKVNISTQMFYVALSTLTYSCIYSIFFGGGVLNLGYLGMCLVHGIFFIVGMLFIIKHCNWLL